MKKISHTKAQGHVEMMISFVLFITSIIFIFYLLNPIAEKKTDYSSLTNIERIVGENISFSVTKLTFVSNSTGNCYKIGEEDTGVYVEKTDSSNPRVYYLYFADFLIPNANHNNPECPEKNYTYSSQFQENMIVNESVVYLKKAYENDYYELKESLGINEEFSFDFSTLEGTIIPELSVEKESFSGVERVAKQVPVRIIDKNGNINEFIMGISSW